MHVFGFCAYAVMVAVVVLAMPKPPDQALSTAQVKHPQYFFLRANCPSEPWQGRSIVALPTSQRLGLENFTVAPTTPGLNFRPIQVASGNYALQGEGENDEHSNAPYLVALKPANGTQITALAVLHLPQPDRGSSGSNLEVCPEDFECIANQWTFDAAGEDMVHLNFKFAGNEGEWEPVKDAAPEGWHIYWKGGGGLYHPIALDLVPS